MTANPNAGTNFNAYWYAANNPYTFADPDGREIRYASGAAAGSYRNIATAIRYLNANGLANGIGQVNLSKEIITVRPAQDRSDVYQNRYDPNTKTLYWADKSALRITDLATGESGNRSPALIMGHEFEHAANQLADPGSFANDIQTPDSQFDNQEERNVIEEYENPGAEKLGEPTRDGHTGSGEPVKTNCIKAVCP